MYFHKTFFTVYTTYAHCPSTCVRVCVLYICTTFGEPFVLVTRGAFSSILPEAIVGQTLLLPPFFFLVVSAYSFVDADYVDVFMGLKFATLGGNEIKSNSFYFKFILININLECRFSVL